MTIAGPTLIAIGLVLMVSGICMCTVGRKYAQRKEEKELEERTWHQPTDTGIVVSLLTIISSCHPFTTTKLFAFVMSYMLVYVSPRRSLPLLMMNVQTMEDHDRKIGILTC